MIHTTNLDLFAGIPVADYAAGPAWYERRAQDHVPRSRGKRDRVRRCSAVTRSSQKSRLRRAFAVVLVVVDLNGAVVQFAHPVGAGAFEVVGEFGIGR